VSPTRLLTGLLSMALLVLGLVVLLPDCASACSCYLKFGITEQERAERELDRATSVFAGEVVKLKKGVGTNKVSFRVAEVWKGPEQETLEVRTPRYGMSCGYSFKEGREYLVYAEGKKMNVTYCGRTTLLSKASADLQVLGNGETLGGSGVLSDTSGGVPPLGVMGMLGGVVSLVSLVVLMRLVRTG
jgi:hypothetical protein